MHDLLGALISERKNAVLPGLMIINFIGRMLL